MQRIGRQVQAALLALVLVLIASPASAGQDTFAFDPPIEDELLLQVVLERDLVLSDAIIAYRDGPRVRLPLAELAMVLDYAIVVDADARRAEGWFLDRARGFVLDLDAGRVTIAGRTHTVSPEDVGVFDGEIYVAHERWQDWFPLEFTVDLPRLTLQVAALEPLPVQARAERRRRQTGLGRFGIDDDAPRLPRHDIPYRAIDLPTLDINLAAGVRHDDRTRLLGSYSVIAAGDLAWLNGRLFAAGREDEALDSLRLTLGRRDPDAGLLGPLRATAFDLGDVAGPTLPLVARARTGRGVELTNGRLGPASAFDRITLIGDLPPGFEIELYRNGVLLDFQTPDDDNRYEFVDVPLLFGFNEIRLVFYGPQGERREEVQTFLIGPGQLTPGEFRYNVAAVQEQRSLFGISDERGSGRGSGREGAVRAVAGAEYGLHRNLSLAASYATLRLDDEDARRHYGIVGLRGQAGGVFLRGDVGIDDAGGTAGLIGAQTQRRGINVSAQHEHYAGGFVSEQSEEGSRRLRTRSDLRITTGLGGVWTGASTSFAIEHKRFVDGGDETELRHRLSGRIAALTASNELRFDIDRSADESRDRRFDGNFRLSGLYRAMRLRGEARYRIDPDATLESLAATADRPLPHEGNLNLRLRHDFDNGRRTSFGAGYSRRIHAMRFGIGGDVDTEGDLRVFANLSFALARDPQSGRPRLFPDGLHRQGGVVGRVFVDEHATGRFDPNDTPIEAAGFTASRGARSDRRGIVVLTELPTDRVTDLALDPATLEDPFWLPASEGFAVLARPGRFPVLDFPVVRTGEIEGVVYLARDGELREAANVRLQLLDREGQIVDEVRSAFDGFYLFQTVRPGSYDLRIDPEQLAMLDLEAPAPLGATITPEHDIAVMPDIVLERRGAGVDPTP